MTGEAVMGRLKYKRNPMLRDLPTTFITAALQTNPQAVSFPWSGHGSGDVSRESLIEELQTRPDGRAWLQQNGNQKAQLTAEQKGQQEIAALIAAIGALHGITDRLESIGATILAHSEVLVAAARPQVVQPWRKRIFSKSN
jgi:hypothetical protein